MSKFYLNASQILTTTDGQGTILTQTELSEQGFTPHGLTQTTWSDNHATVARTPSLSVLSNPLTLALKNTLLVLDADVPTCAINMQADNTNTVGTNFGMTLVNTANNNNFEIRTDPSYTGSVVFKEFGSGASTDQTAIQQGTMTLSDATYNNVLTQNSITLNDFANDITCETLASQISINNLISSSTQILSETSLQMDVGNVVVDGEASYSLTGNPASSTVLLLNNKDISPFQPTMTTITLQSEPTNCFITMESVGMPNLKTVELNLDTLSHISTSGNFSIETNNTLLLISDNLTAGANTLTSTNNGVGYTTPQFQLTNTNGAVGVNNGVPSMETFKSGRNAVSGDTTFGLFNYAKGVAGVKTLFSKIECAVRNTGVAGNEDGSIGIFALLNNTMTEFFRFNGSDGENNSFKDLDMNGQSIKSSTTNLSLSATGSSGVGAITIAPKADQPVTIPAQVDPTSDFIKLFPSIAGIPNTTRILSQATNNATTWTSTIDLFNQDIQPQIEIKADFGGATNKSLIFKTDGAGSSNNKIISYDGQTNLPLQIDTSGYVNGSIELKVNDSSGDLLFTGTNLQSGTSSSSSGQYLRIKLNGVYYKIALDTD